VIAASAVVICVLCDTIEQAQVLTIAMMLMARTALVDAFICLTMPPLLTAFDLTNNRIGRVNDGRMYSNSARVRSTEAAYFAIAFSYSI